MQFKVPSMSVGVNLTLCPSAGMLSHCQRPGDLTLEQSMNYVLDTFMEEAMVKLVIQEAAALASLSLFVGMIAIWSQVLGAL